jgi:hypothetical protein
MSDPESQSNEVGSQDPVGESRTETRSEPTTGSPRGDHGVGETQPGNRGFDTIQAHVAHEGGATCSRTDGRRNGATDPSPKGGRRTASGAGDHVGNDGDGSDGSSRSSVHFVFGRGRNERQEGSRPQRCGTAADEEQTFAGWSASGDDGPGPRSFGFDDRPAENLANPDPVPAATCRDS